MSQSKRESWIETGVTVFVGFWWGVFSQMLVMPLVGIEATPLEHMQMAGYFLVTGTIYRYIIRRWFNARAIRQQEKAREENRPD